MYVKGLIPDLKKLIVLVGTETMKIRGTGQLCCPDVKAAGNWRKEGSLEGRVGEEASHRRLG